MARTNQAGAATADADPNAVTDPSPNGATPAAVTEPKTTGSVMVQMPTELKELVEKKAEEDDVTVAAFVRKLLADAFNYILPAAAPRGRKSKYAGMTPEQAKAAKQSDKDTRQKAIRALYAAAKAGELNIEELIAKYAADVGGKAKPDAPAEENTIPPAEPVAV